MSESLTVEGWRVRDDLAVDFSVRPELTFEPSLKRRRYRRGELVRRTLLLADVAGIVVAFVLANILVPHDGNSADRVSSGMEYLALLLAIPFWVLLLRLEGLYDRDEERTDHSTVDDIVGVFRSVTIGVWVLALVRRRYKPRPARPRPARDLLAPRRPTNPDVARVRARRCVGTFLATRRTQ